MQADLLKAFAAGFGAFLVIILVVFATGATFGQRCERYYPNASPLTVDRCVEHLSNGGAIEELRDAG